MEQMVRVAKPLRVEHKFGGYIHLKAAPTASAEITQEAGRWADRLSANTELSGDSDLAQLAPAKTHGQIEISVGQIADGNLEVKDKATRAGKSPRFASAGQSTQFVVGATDAPDKVILEKASALYKSYGLRRAYYSAFSPIPDSSSILPLVKIPLVREHRLYQADWLMRFYGFDVAELTTKAQPNLDLSKDPNLPGLSGTGSSSPLM